MILFTTLPPDFYAQRLLDDLQNAGFSISTNPAARHDVKLVFVTSSGVSIPDDTETPLIIIQLENALTPASLRGKRVDLYPDYVRAYQAVLGELGRLAAVLKRNPYRGLYAYGEIDQPIFYGRQPVVQWLHDHIAGGNRFAALIGDVGSGKTSLLRAGLIPLLRNTSENWLPLYIRLGRQPVRQLAHVLGAVLKNPDSLFNALYSNRQALSELVSQITDSGTRLLLVMDDLEALFNYASVADRVYVLDLLYNTIQQASGTFTICLVLQTEFKKRLQEYPNWNRLLDGNLVTVPPLEQADWEAIVQKPSQAAGVAFDETLVSRIISDVTRLEKPGTLSLLSFELSRLFESGNLTLDTYDEHGGVSSSFSQLTEQVYDSLTPIQQRVAQRIFLQMLEFTEDETPVLGLVPYSQIRFTWVDTGEIDRTLERLLTTQILTASLDVETGERYIQITNPIVLQEWHRYADWLNESSEELRYRSRLERLAAVWVAHEYSEQTLLRGIGLDEAISWVQNPDHFVSPLLQNFVDVSSQIRQSVQSQQVAQQKRRRRLLRGLVAALVVTFLIIAGISVFAVKTVQDKNALATVQANLNHDLSTAQGVQQAFVVTIDNMATQQSDLVTQQADTQNQLATSVAQNDLMATGAALTATANAGAGATIEALVTQIASNAEALGSVASLQQTLDASIEKQQLLQAYVVGSLAQSAERLSASDPAAALRLVAEAGTRELANVGDGGDPRISQAMKTVLKSNLSLSVASDVARSWFINNNTYAILDYADKPDELWQLNPSQLVTTLASPVDQIIPVGDGPLFFVDYLDAAVPDEFWNAEENAVIQQLDKDIAPPPDEKATVQIPNFVMMANGTYFVLRYEDEKPSDLWEVASMKSVVTLDGDIEKLTPLQDGYFFAGYTNHATQGGVWEITSGTMVQPADDVVTTNFDNRIFALRRSGQFDEIWRTDPLRKLTQAIGRVEDVTTIQGTDYFIIQYEGNKPAEIWVDANPAAIVQTLRGSIDVSITYLERQYFFIRYNDLSNSEIWRTSPLGMVATLNGHLATTDVKAVLGQEEVIFQYLDNSISELWSLKTEKLLAPLNGDVAAVLPIQGDSFFAVRYKNNQPAEVWNAITGQLVGTLGSQNLALKNIVSLNDGAYLALVYEDASAEIWQFGVDKMTLVTTLPDIATNLYALENGTYFVVNYQTSPAEFWQPGAPAPLITFDGGIQQFDYNHPNKILGYVTTTQSADILNVGLLQQVESTDPPLTDTDLLALVCDQITKVPPVPDEVITPYLAGLEPSACTTTPEEATPAPGG